MGKFVLRFSSRRIVALHWTNSSIVRHRDERASAIDSISAVGIGFDIPIEQKVRPGVTGTLRIEARHRFPWRIECLVPRDQSLAAPK
ncbi:hypothetical protein N7414_03720 [Pseudomonas sp. GD04087]|uniref:hypothetical protein n=1 Tax=unclassified Pseudomonas TaxID=196821 RepID=UPI00244B40BC|nr:MULTISPECIES: hypothetical protein [unclassified Pseudomonas]MDH0288212.1 hypothetical protein [Pseudomonas sp. GD04087]MDH1048965.1 hypothetical protein [Pseudomonas sp. GD03903]MDH1999598.1 hypothetical protein [Pseudomonas sp. GD03691]